MREDTRLGSGRGRGWAGGGHGLFGGARALPLILGLVFLGSSAAGCARCAPGKEARLASSSKEDSACRKELAESLVAIVKHLGMKTQATMGDVEALVEEGKVVKGYSRDGVQYQWEIGLRKKDGKCLLMAYKREMRRPGKSETSWANHGSVKLSVCRCE